MRVTKKDNAVYYMPQEVREIVTTDVTYMPVTRELLEKYFQKATKEDKRKLVKKKKTQVERHSKQIQCRSTFLVHFTSKSNNMPIGLRLRIP